MELRKTAALWAIFFLIWSGAAAGWTQTSVPAPLLSVEGGAHLDRLPFEQGEEVRYAIHWKPLFLFPAFKAGEVRLVLQKTEYHQRDAFKICAWASSDGLLKSVAGLDVRDYFESTIDGESFRSERFFQQTRQNRRQRDLEVVMDYPGDRALIREFDVSVDPPRQIRNEVRKGVPDSVADALSVFYAARLREMKPGDRYRVHLSSNGKISEVRLTVERAEKVKIDLGRYQTVKITTNGGFFNGGGDFRIWYTQDDLRIPVKFEADAKFGKLFGHLVQIRTKRFSKGLIRID